MFTNEELKEMEIKLLEGFKLDTSLGSSYTGETSRNSMKIIEVIREYNDNQNSDKQCIFQIRNRVYIINDKGVKYYSIKGEGQYRFLSNWEVLFNFIKKPSKTKKFVKMFIIDKDIDEGKFVNENIK